MKFAPDGRLFVWQKNGVVRVIKNGQLLPTPFIDLSAKVNTYDDRGFWGLAFDPQFASQRLRLPELHVRERRQPQLGGARTSRLTRVTADPANPDIALPGSETVILGSIGTPPCSGLPAERRLHRGRQRLAHARGPSLRRRRHAVRRRRRRRRRRIADPTRCARRTSTARTARSCGSGPTAPRRRTTRSMTGRTPGARASGSTASATRSGSRCIRTPRRSSSATSGGTPGRRSTTALPGRTSAGRASRGTARSRYQSSSRSARQLRAELGHAPFYTYDHSSGSAAIGGPIYTGTLYPQQYRDNFFFADYSGNFIRRVVLDAQHRPVSSSCSRPMSRTRSRSLRAPTGCSTTCRSRRARCDGSATTARSRTPRPRRPTVLAALGVVLERRDDQPRRRVAHVPVGLRRRHDVDRRQSVPHLHDVDRADVHGPAHRDQRSPACRRRTRSR